MAVPRPCSREYGSGGGEIVARLGWRLVDHELVVGRGARALLANRRDVPHARVVAP